MSTLAVRLAVSAAVASVVMTGIEALRTRHPRAAAHPQSSAEPLGEDSEPAPRLARQLPPAIEAAPPKAPAAPNPLAMAKIHGRVLGKDAAAATVTVADGEREYEAALDGDGNYEMNLPPGSYTLMASTGDEVAEAQVDDLVEDEDREVVLVLAGGVAIEGRVSGSDGRLAQVDISARPAGTSAEPSVAQTDLTGAFRVDGLLAGRKYDLVFEASGKRRLVLPAVAAPKRDLVVTLEPSPTLSGGFGVERGQTCPMVSVSVASKDEVDAERDFDRHCRFEIQDLPDGDSVHLRAIGKGWHFEVDVPIPSHGNPPFLCLRQPCREPEPDVEASLQIAFSGSTAGPVQLSVQFPGGGVFTSCDPASDDPCTLSELKPAAGVKVVVTPALCEPRTFTVDLHPGTNVISMHCQALRRIHGMLRTSGDADAASQARVRCSSENAASFVHNLFFLLACPEHQASIEYQLSPTHPWQTVAIKPGNAKSIAFVDIAVD